MLYVELSSVRLFSNIVSDSGEGITSRLNMKLKFYQGYILSMMMTDDAIELVTAFLYLEQLLDFLKF